MTDNKVDSYLLRTTDPHNVYFYIFIINTRVNTCQIVMDAYIF